MPAASPVLEGDLIVSRHDDARLYEGVLTRRMMAFVLDYLIIGLLMVPVLIVMTILGVATLGLGFLLMGPALFGVVILYIWNTLGGPSQATVGMRAMSIRLERLDGRPVDGLFAVVHSVLFWASASILTPFILLAALFLSRKRTLHDLLLGTVDVRTDA